jgi:hypothetical protein
VTSPWARGWPALLALALAVLVAGCDDSGGDLGNQVITSIPGYTASSSDSGAIDRDSASTSLPTQKSQTASALDAAGFRAGYSRIFLRDGKAGGDYVLVSAYAMASAEASQRFVMSERSALQGTGTVVLFTPDGLQDSVGFTLTGPTQRGDRQVFCDGVVAAKNAKVYAVTTCSATPEDSKLAVDVARRQAAAG